MNCKLWLPALLVLALLAPLAALAEQPIYDGNSNPACFGVSSSDRTVPIMATFNPSTKALLTDCTFSPVVIDYDTSGATQSIPMMGIALPGSGGAVAGGTSTNPVIAGLAAGTADIGLVHITGNAAGGAGQTAVTTHGTAVQLADHACKEAIVACPSGNTNPCYVRFSAGSGLTGGLQVAKGTSITFHVSNTNLLYVDTGTDTESVTWAYTN